MLMWFYPQAYTHMYGHNVKRSRVDKGKKWLHKRTSKRKRGRERERKMTRIEGDSVVVVVVVVVA